MTEPYNVAEHIIRQRDAQLRRYGIEIGYSIPSFGRNDPMHTQLREMLFSEKRRELIGTH